MAFKPLRFIGRWLFRGVILLIVLGAVLLLLKDSLLKSLAEHRIRTETGLEAKFGKFELGLFTPVLHIENLVLYNPPEFGGSPLLKLPELHVEYDREAIASQRLHVILLRLNMAELNVVENQAGISSLQVLQEFIQKRLAFRKRLLPVEFTGIDTMNVTLDRVVITSLKPPGSTRELPLGIKNEIVKNVKTAQDLSGLLFKILPKLAGKGLFGG